MSANGSQSAPAPSDLFADAQGRPRRLRGAIMYAGSTRLAELAGKVGFETVWIEMEHGPTEFSEVETLCMAAQCGGAAPAVRVSGHHRDHVLRALECGARLIIVPMVNTAEQARELVSHAKFPPLGQRGFNLRSRAMQYGLAPVRELMDRANRDTHLFVQIETPEAVANIDAICAVEGVSGVLVGPGDLSANMGLIGELNHPRVVEVVTSVIRRARQLGGHAGILVAPGKLLEAALDAGCDLAFYAGDIMDLSKLWVQSLGAVRSEVSDPHADVSHP